MMRPKVSKKRQNDNRSREKADRHSRAEAEYRDFCETLRERIAEGGLPPDEAYWWTRIAVGEAVLLKHTPA